MGSTLDQAISRGAEAIRAAEFLLFSAGAGMGVDSGLPDFRGPEGFWRAYPAYRHLGLEFSDMANPRWFADDPAFAWGFYGHRLNLYRATIPHLGFAILKDWSQSRSTFIFTSNVDGQFQSAGFEEHQLFEVHGAIRWAQCTQPCTNEVWNAGDLEVRVDEQTFRAGPPLPQCPHCSDVARPNILMFGDWRFLGTRCEEQAQRYQRWRAGLDARKTVVIEMGAGTSIPTVRHEGEALLRKGATLIRINPREPQGPSGTLSLPMGALAGVTALKDKL